MLCQEGPFMPEERRISDKTICSWSGGTDSRLALYRARQAGVMVPYLLNMVCEENGQSAPSHSPSSKRMNNALVVDGHPFESRLEILQEK